MCTNPKQERNLRERERERERGKLTVEREIDDGRNGRHAAC
jgi:hypothetical protein